MFTKQRARAHADKLARRQDILEAALVLWQGASFNDFTMGDVAARLELAKGTLYLYFNSKEELLLTILERLLNEWFDDVDARLDEDGDWNAARVADVIRGAVEKRDVLTRLLAITATILEHNIEFDAAVAFKKLLLQRAAATGTLLERRLSFLQRGEGARILVQIHALLVGFRQMADPAPIIRRVLEEPMMGPLRVEFGPQFALALTALLLGLERLQDERKEESRGTAHAGPPDNLNAKEDANG